MFAQEKLEELLKNTTTNRLATLMNALSFELFGFIEPGECTGYRECNDTSRYVQHASANIVGVALEELTDEEKKEEIKKIINGTITEHGDLENGTSLQQTKKVATEVWECLQELF
ncbi:unnamed protein product [Nippostrongylus brasiliensis]|uniref:Fels-2 prophage protein n=1 Tax=Nippostrongylus brasiliensis TaxID=27835 RepID=A0A0N4YJI4_NIPBR|nr:unnamed protein product [Nippostrongylus brasiliensis]